MPSKDQFAKMMRTPGEFRRVLKIDTDSGPRPLAEVAEPWQVEDFAALDEPCRAVATRGLCQVSRAWLERPRGHSKTSDIAVVVSWLLFASRYQLAGVAAAADQDQARLLRDAILRLTLLNPWLGKFLEVKQNAINNWQTKSTLSILTADAPSAYGLTPDFVVADEVTHWGKQDFWNALFSAAAKRRNCLFLTITNAGFMESWQWQIREAVRQDAGWHFHALDGPHASWITPERLAEQRRLLPGVAFDRLWLNRWGTGAGDALADDDIKAAVTLPGPASGPELGWLYVAGVDLGLSKDAAALAVVGVDVGNEIEEEEDFPEEPLPGYYLRRRKTIEPTPEDRVQYRQGSGRFRLARLNLWQPQRGRKVELAPIEAAILHLHSHFSLRCVGVDPWQAAYLSERLGKQGVPIESVDFVSNNLKSMASATLDAFSERQLDLFEDDQLLADLRALRVEERQYGVRLVSPRGPGGHGDAATGLAIALHISRRYRQRGGGTVARPLVCWP